MNRSLQSSHLRCVYINGEKDSKPVIGSVIYALNNKKIIIEKGGFLFKVSISDDCLYFGLVPNFINGERTHHYDIELTVEDEFTLIGSITDDDKYSILFKPENRPFTAAVKTTYSDSYVRFARFLYENGYEGRGELDWSTCKIFEEADVFGPEIKSLFEIAVVKCSKDDMLSS
ncbi:hypothetical protein KAR48_06205 [bacterium]|nr:hypothetical protein [bacterium]